LEERDELLRIGRLQHKSVPAGNRVVFSGPTGAGETARRHGLQPDQSERLVTAVGENRVGSPEQDATGRWIQMGTQIDHVHVLQSL
jgi:hypothetical protein